MLVALSGAYNTLGTGPSTVHEGLARALAGLGHDVAMLTHGDRSDPPCPGVSVHRIGDRPSSVLAHHRIYRDAKRLARELDADVYHALEDQPQSSDVKTVQWVTTAPELLLACPEELDLKEELGDVVLNLFSRTGAMRAGHVVASSPETKRQMERYWRCSPAEIVPLGVRSSSFAEPSPVSAPPSILFAGRLTPKKGQRRVLRYLDPDSAAYDVNIVGGRSDEDYADSILEDWRESYRGFVSEAELDEWYRTSDVTVVGSHHENFSMVAVEAIARGNALVITDACGFAQFPEVRRCDGVRVVSDGREAAWAVKSLIEDDLARSKRRARDLAESFAWEDIAERYARIYDDVHT